MHRVSVQPSSYAEVLLCKLTSQRGSPLRDDLERFALGEPLATMPRLQLEICKLLCVPVTERAAGAPHGKIKKDIAVKRHGPVSVSMSRVRHIPLLLGISAHPWLTTMPGKSLTSAWVSVLS